MRVMLVSQLAVLSLQVLQHFLLLVRFLEVPPPPVEDVQPEGAVGGQQQTRPHHFQGEGPVLHRLVVHAVEGNVSVPLPCNRGQLLHYLLRLYPLHRFLLVEGQQSLDSLACYLEDASSQVWESYLLLVLVNPLLILPHGVLEIRSTFCLEDVASAGQLEHPVAEHYASELEVRETDDILRLAGVNFDLDGSWQFGVGRVEADVDHDLDVAVSLELLVFHEEGGDRGVVASLLHVEGDASDASLEGLPQYRVEGLADLGVAAEHEDEGQGHVLDLLLKPGLLHCLVHEHRSEPKYLGEAFKGGVVIEDLNWQGHGHDGLPGHEVGSYLLEDELEHSFLKFEFLLVREDVLFRVAEPPTRPQQQVIDPLAQVVVRSREGLLVESLREPLLQVVVLVDLLLNDPNDRLVPFQVV